MDFGAISWLGVAIAAVAFFAIGGIWYGPLFGKLWRRASGVTDEEVEGSNIAAIFVGTLVLEAVAAIGIAALIGADSDVASGIGTAVLVAVLIVVPVLVVQALYDRKPPLLWLLNGGYNLVGFVAMGAIIGALQ